MYVPRNLVLGDATMRNPVKYVMVETEEDPDTAPEGKQGQFIPSEDLERVFEEKDVQFIPSEDLKTTLVSEEEHFIPSEDLKTTPEWKYEHLVPSDDLVSETHGQLTPSAVKIKKNPVKYSTFLKIHKKGEKDTSEGKYEPVTLSGDQEGTGGPLIQSDVKVNKSPVKYSTFRTKDQEQDTPVRRADLTPSSTKVNKHMTRDRDSSMTTTTTTMTTKTKRPTKDRPGSSSSTNSNPPELHYRKPGEAEDATGDHQLSRHVSGDSSLLTHLLTHLLQPSPHHHHHHHLLQPSASERSVWNKNSKNIHAGMYFKSLTNDGSFSSRQRRSVAIRRKREEVEWPVEVRVEEGGVRDVDVESGRQLVQNTVALITANPGLVLVFALSIWVVWAVAVGFDPISYLNSFGTGAPGGGGSSGGSSVVSSSSSSAVVLGALDSPPALSLPAVQGADISPVLTDGEPSPALDDAEPSPDAESVPTDDGGTPAAESGGPSLDGTTGDTSPVSDEGSAPPPSDADNPPSDPTSTDDATASDAVAPADDDTAPETPVSDGTDADSADSGDIDAESAASDDTAADSPASDDTAADSPASDDTAADSPASDDTAVDSPASDDTAVDSPASDDTAVDSPASGDTAVDSPASDDTAVDSPASGDTAADSPASDDTAVDSPASDDTAADSPASGDTAGVTDGAGDGSAVDEGTGEDPLISEGAATGEDVGDSGAATGPGVLFAGAISDATTTEGEAGSLTPAFASLRPSSTTGTTEEALLAVDGAIWEILANISSSITTTESTDGENSPPKLPPLPVPTGDLTGPIHHLQLLRPARLPCAGRGRALLRGPGSGIWRDPTEQDAGFPTTPYLR
ncbi:uncharacterized protein LOC135094297 [Scylla paramamosain]|uniref:uncharacterized protein LOC135094297 n=1 Tax=Scylla paramamosain TaxID=85552 RepID=UPI0030839B66